jgi:AcrR family transcriptional regulator
MTTTSMREEILAAAMDIFGERGYRKTSIDAVAARTGLTRQGVLHYFPSKRALLLAIIERRHQVNIERLADGDAEKDWPSQLASVIAFEESHRSMAELHNALAAEVVTGSDEAQEYFNGYYRSSHDHIVARLGERYGDRLPSGLTSEAAATALLAMLEGIQLQSMLDGQEHNDHPEVMREVWSVLLGSTPV